MSKYTRSVSRAALVAALYELDREGLLELVSATDLARLLPGDHHRATAWRYTQDVEILRELVPRLKAEIQDRLDGV